MLLFVCMCWIYVATLKRNQYSILRGRTYDVVNSSRVQYHTFLLREKLYAKILTRGYKTNLEYGFEKTVACFQVSYQSQSCLSTLCGI